MNQVLRGWVAIFLPEWSRGMRKSDPNSCVPIWGQMGTAWGRTPTPRPAGLPRPRNAWQGPCRCSRKQTHRFGSPNLPLWVAVGRCGSRGDTSRSTNFLCTKKLRAKLLQLGISPGISLLLFDVAVALLRPGPHGPGPCCTPPGSHTYG